MRGWTTDDSLSLYQVPQWGKDHFSINEAGHVCVQPRGPGGPELDLLAIVEDLEGQGYRTPLLLRFSDILESRLRALSGCFGRAIESHGYRGRYAPVYPIKVNQQRHVVEELVNLGAPLGVGLEAGSRPELLIAWRCSRTRTHRSSATATRTAPTSKPHSSPRNWAATPSW
ncbi:MAG: hypothetical protein VCC68_06950 [Myxococcota bacterium]